MAKPYLIIGAGSFGARLAESLSELGADVIVLDQTRAPIEALKDKVSIAAVCKASDREALAKIVSDGIELAVITMTEKLEPSLFSALVLKDLGVERIIARARDEDHGRLLEMLGVESVLYPEQEYAQNLARSLHSPGMKEYFDLGSDHGIAETKVLEEWVGKPLHELKLRYRHGINLIAVKRPAKPPADPDTFKILSAGPDTVLAREDTVMIFAALEDFEKLGLC